MDIKRSQAIRDEFEFRNIRPEEWTDAADMEKICFPPNEACTPEQVKERAEKAAQLFLVAIERKSGELAGMINGVATDENKFADKFFLSTDFHQADGKNVMILGLDVLPSYRKRGLASELMLEYAERERAKGRRTLILTCHHQLIPMYEKMGFVACGKSASTWGGEEWFEMVCDL